MERKECFGSIQETTHKGGFAMTQFRPQCRDCRDLRDCLRYGKESLEDREASEKKNALDELNELRKQEMITRIIDLSEMLSNELGSCLLEFLNRIYSSPVASVLLKNLLLFYEIPPGVLSHKLTIPISSSTLNLFQGGEGKTDQPGQYSQGGPKKDVFSLQIVLLHRSFPNNRKANVGLIAYQVAYLFSSDRHGINQISQVLSDSERDLFTKMEAKQRIRWLVEVWGFQEEYMALRKEVAFLDFEKGNQPHPH